MSGAINATLLTERSSTKRSRIRARTVSIKRLAKRELEIGRLLYPDVDVQRPVTRADCLQGENAERPCPFVSCKYHLYLDVNEVTGSIKLNFPDLEVWELPESCALDVAAEDGHFYEVVGEHLNITRQRVHQIEQRLFKVLKDKRVVVRALALLEDEPEWQAQSVEVHE